MSGRQVDEAGRLASLARYRILDTPPEPAFERITAMAARLFDVPIALVVLVDQERQWFKSRHGLELPETSRVVSFCAHSILEDTVMVVEDARTDPRFADNALVTGPPGIVFYAGAPLVAGDGHIIGTVAIIDRVPRTLDGSQRGLLRSLARIAMDEIELRAAAGAKALALEEADPRIRLMLEQLPAAVWTCDRGLKVTSASGALLADFGVTAADAVGHTIADYLVGPEGVDAVAAHRSAIAGESVAYPITWRGFALEIHLRPLRDAVGTSVGAIGIALDVTDRQRLHDRLAQAERLAALGTLSAGVAHEVNNPLTYISLNLGMALNVVEATADATRSDPALVARLDRMRRLLNDAMTGASRVKATVADLVTFARAGAASDEVPSDPIRVIESAIAMAMGHIQHVARLECALEPIPPIAIGEARLAQVCLNLLVNAAQAIPEGHVADNVIRVATAVHGDRVHVRVSDTGTGIAPDDLRRIFDPFFTTKPIGGGTGLGLSIVRGIVEQAGGTISVDRAGAVTTFHVELPVAAARPARSLPRAQAQPAAARRRVLVVDDDPLITRVISGALEARHEVVTVDSGRAALDLLATDPAFDVILCDLLTPDVSGMELHAELQRSASGLAGRIVFMTAGAFTPGASRFLQDVDRPVLAKPFDLDELDRVVQR